MTALTYRRRKRLLAKAPDETVRLYTYQHPAAWDAARSRGYLTGDPAFADPDYAHAYRWMSDRMRERIPDWSGDLPVWGYLARSNARHDLYCAEPVLQVAADVPRSRMLLSDVERWLDVLNRVHVVDTESEMEALEDGGEQTYRWPREVTPAMEASWEGVFDLDESGWSAEKLRYWGSPDVVQACVDRIRIDEVAWVGTFAGRAGRNRKPR